MGLKFDQVYDHGFRATARTILEEVLEYPANLIEMQLGLKVREINKRAYNQTWKIKQWVWMIQT